MDFDEYQKLASRTGDFSSRTREYTLMYLSMGLAGETGEVIEKLKKVIRNDNGAISPEKHEDLKREIGDVLWYASQLALHLDMTFDDVAQTNIAKLADRAKRQVIVSEGDNR